MPKKDILKESLAQELIDKVALDIAKKEFHHTSEAMLAAIAKIPYRQEVAKAAIESVHKHEKCSECHCKLNPPALCDECSHLYFTGQTDDYHLGK
jgi:hypothetical protein